MTEDRLRELLKADITAAEREAEERGWAVVKAAYAERTAAAQPRSHRALMLALAGAALLAVLLFSPAGAQVRSWIEEVVEPGVQNARPALTHVPGGGRLVVEAGGAVWIVGGDGSQRRLGNYEQASASPSGAFVAATSGWRLAAVVANPDDPLASGDAAGTVRWTVTAKPPIADPAWSPSGFRVAYLAGEYEAGAELHVVAGDGTPDELIASRVSPVGPAWRPLPTQAPPSSDGLGTHDLAYVDSRGRVVVRDTDTGKVLANWLVRDRVRQLSWARDGHTLAVVGETRLILLDLREPSPVGSVELAGRAEGAVFGPDAESRDLVVAQSHAAPDGGTSSTVERVHVGFPGEADKREQLFAATGRIEGPVLSPHADWVQLGWQDADQWLFIRPSGGKPEAVDNISRQFDPGHTGPAAFPRISGWCCAP
jgi:hypothetical protein